MAKDKASSLEEVLQSYKPEAPDFGEKEPKAKRAEPAALERLRRDLQNVSAANGNYFRICVALLLILFAGACALMLRSLEKPTEIAAIFGASGISLMGIVTQMARLWKQKVGADMMLALAGNMRPQDFKSVVEIVLKSYLK